MANIVTHLGKNLNWYAYRNGINTFTTTFTSDSDPFDISTRSFSCNIRKVGFSDNIVTLTEADGIVNNGSDGTLVITLTDTKIANLLPKDNYFYEIIYEIDDETYPLFQGMLRIIAEENPVSSNTSVNAVINLSGTNVNVAVTLAGGNSGGGSITSEAIIEALGYTPADEDDLAGKEDVANKGQPDGYASLDESGKVPSTQLPSYFDDPQTISDEWTFNESPIVPTAPSGDNSSKAANTQWVRENTLAITEDEQDAIPAGETNLFTVTKSIDGTEVTYGAGVRQIDNFGYSGLSSLLADNAAWVGDAITLTGDNREGQLGQAAQEFVISNSTGTMYKCVSHITGVTSSDGSATWIRTRSKDNLDETADAAIITALTNETGWSSNVKVITIRSKVGSWYTSISGYTYFCFDEAAGTSWSWRRIGEPDAIPVQITDEDLIEEIEAHDFGTTAMLVPSSTVKGEDRQQHFWVTGGTVPNLALCIDVSGVKTWIKIK